MEKSDLPAGAREYNGSKVNEILNKLLKKDIAFQESGTGLHYVTNDPEFLEGFDVTASIGKDSPEKKRLFNGNPLPRIDGSSYYLGMAVNTGEGTVLLYTPGIQKFVRPEDMQRFRVFTLGKVSDKKVLKVVETYRDNMSRYIRETLPKGGMKDTD